MIDASRARQIASDTIGAKAQMQLEMIEKTITEAAENGSLLCQVEDYLLPQVETHLKHLGYRVKRQSARNECWTTINWDTEAENV